jgi:DNA-binding LacI/PurR family transcriptional regulator
MEVAMTDEKSVLVIGLDPTLIDFSHPDYAGTGMDATKVLAGLKSSEDELTRLGYSVQMCLTDFGETAEAVVQSQLKQKRFDCILIGAGTRTNPSNFMLFEKLINVVNEHAPQAKVCFDTMPSDTAAAVKRWL